MGILYSRVKEVFSGTEFAADLVFFFSKSNCDVFWSVSQQVSGQDPDAAGIFLPVQRTVFRRARLHMCVWWQMSWGSHQAHREVADNLQSLSSVRLGSRWALQRAPNRLSTHSVGLLGPFIAALRCKYIRNRLSILPAETSKPLRTNICSCAD